MVDVSSNKLGGVGEALVFGGNRIPAQLDEAVMSFVEERYRVGDPSKFIVGSSQGVYLQARTVDDEEVGWQTDGLVTVEWVSPEKAEEIDDPRLAGRPQDRSARFPVDVKTGEYAELSDRQKQVAEAVAKAETQVHPTVVSVGVEGLPDSFEMSTRILG